MKIAEWKDTIEAERNYWVNAIEVWMATDGLERARDVYWAYKAEIILESLRCLDALPMDDSRILEIGGGLVDVMRWFEKGSLYAIEPLWLFFEQYRQRLSWEGLREDVIPFASKAEGDYFQPKALFDIVLILNTLDHCEDPEVVMRRISYMIKPGGLLYESTTVWGDKKVNINSLAKTHPHLFQGGELRMLIKRNGFEEVGDPYCGGNINEPWTARWQEGAWPTYLRVWRRR